jgi:hypothetical protein
MIKRYWIFAIFCLLPVVVKGLGPHEIALLVNTNSEASIRIAEHFVSLREIPKSNIVRLGIRPEVLKSGRISLEEFISSIWEPAWEVLRSNNSAERILAWCYSADFPILVTTDPPVSIIGITFLRTKLPSPKCIRDGLYRSPLFCGPHRPWGSVYSAQSFDTYKEWLAEDYPLPAMMLGYTGENGNTINEVLQCIERGVQSDGTAPTGSIYFVVSDDVRSTCRDWQFAGASQELASKKVLSVITNVFPQKASDVMGIMIGSTWVNGLENNKYLPGAMAEHLTSLAAVFDTASQMKLTAWIKAGATITAGTVTEPMSIWTKFPSAYFYVHYASGCTAIESLYQSIRCPLQILLLGEPLAQPWAPGIEVTLDVTGNEVSGEPERVSMRVKSNKPLVFKRFCFMLDDTIIQDGNSSVLVIDSSRLKPGKHTIRAVAYSDGLIRFQKFAIKHFEKKKE